MVTYFYLLSIQKVCCSRSTGRFRSLLNGDICTVVRYELTFTISDHYNLIGFRLCYFICLISRYFSFDQTHLSRKFNTPTRRSFELKLVKSSLPLGSAC